MKKKLLLLQFLAATFFADAQNNVGINTSSPQASLDVRGTERVGGINNYIKYDSATGRIEWNGASLWAPASQQIIKHSASSEGLYAGGGKLEYRNTSGPVFFSDWTNGNGYFSGKLGIGTINPSAGSKLHIYDGASGITPFFSARVVVETNSHTYINLLAPDPFETGILFGSGTAAVSGLISYNSTTVPKGFIFNNNGNQTRMVINSVGSVGIGTTVPLAHLHVSEGSGLFSASGDIPLTIGLPPIQGQGRRMMWYSDKSAFRVGYVNSNQWDMDSIGVYSFASGFTPVASGAYSTAMGWHPISSGTGSIATGTNTIASGYASTAMGYGTTAFGDFSTSLGFNTTTYGAGSTAIGYGTNAGNGYSIAMGYSTNSFGYASTSMGNSTRAYGDYSTAMGNNTYAPGISSTAMGSYSIASGNISTAIGSTVQAKADYSVAIGESVTANSWNSISLGSQNDPIATSPTSSWILTDPLLIVGNGTGPSDKKNAFAISKNGNIYIDASNKNDGTLAGNTLLFGTFNGTGEGISSKRTATANQYGLDFYTQSFNRMSITNSGNVGIGISAPSQKLHVVGNICATGSIGVCSDIRYKKNLSPVQNALASIQSLNGIYYYWKQDEFPEMKFSNNRQLGFSAQEVEKLFPEVVMTDDKGYKSVDYGRLTPVLVESIKEQQQQIDELKKQNSLEQQQIAELKKLVEKLVKR